MIKTNENSITFGGTLGKDLEIKGGQNGQKPFGVVSVAQTTYWPKPQGEQGFNERTTWMNIKLNDKLLNKVSQHGGFWKGDEVVVKGHLVQRKVGQEGHIITEIQVESIVSHLPKAVKDLAKQAGYNQPATPAYNNAPQHNAPRHAPVHNTPSHSQPQQPHHAPQRSNYVPQPQHSQPQYEGQPQQYQEWDEEEFYGSRQQ
ncbi:TPA: single-stranded DNA-binding protein [Vibrio parahaemolyticus]|uniref:single-stranded DNA-binding protein n=1 Tax=Vibrio campbellii TaxID=680 RepID=UPI001F08869F|nr:single-stranded DNA-binding protein [Vibrio campbellii]UMM06768.1 single-stranded DNA-binding protein [Vibrio campbellii]